MAKKKSSKKKSITPAAKKSLASARKPASKKTAIKTKPKQAVKKPSLKLKAKTARGKTAAHAQLKSSRVKKILKKPVLRKKPAAKPSEVERNETLRRSLLKKREEILKEAKKEISKYIKGETRQLVDTALDDGDWSVVDLSEDISLRQLGVHHENLQKIDEALRKFNEGTYGICEDCGDEINEKRLKILPFAIYCIDCQEKRERFQEMERREGLL